MDSFADYQDTRATELATDDGVLAELQGKRDRSPALHPEHEDARLGGGIEGADVCPGRASRFNEKRVQRGIGLPHADDDCAMGRIRTEERLSVSVEKRALIGHVVRGRFTPTVAQEKR